MATSRYKIVKIRLDDGYLLTVRRSGEELDIIVDYYDRCVALPTLTKRQVERLSKALGKFAEGMK